MPARIFERGCDLKFANFSELHSSARGGADEFMDSSGTKQNIFSVQTLKEIMT
jgi:hypothetical protein